MRIQSTLSLSINPSLLFNNNGTMERYIIWNQVKRLFRLATYQLLLISDALYYGLENTIQMYLRELRRS